MTLTGFLQFVQDFRPGEARISFDLIEDSSASALISVARRDAQEFLLHKDYTDNWRSEMKETFTHWTWDDWVSKLGEQGFTIHPHSLTYTNLWIRDHRWSGQVRLWQDQKRSLTVEWFPTTMVIAAVKP